MKPIETPRLVLRALLPSDAQALAELWTDPEVTRFMGGPRDFDELRATFLEDAWADEKPIFDLWPVVEKASGEVVGHCGIYDKEVDGQIEYELIYVFARSVWGKGYATEMAAAVRDYAFQQLRLERIIALIDPDNAASERVALKLGASYEKDTIRPGGKRMRLYTAHASGHPGLGPC